MVFDIQFDCCNYSLINYYLRYFELYLDLEFAFEMYIKEEKGEPLDIV